MTTVQNYEKDFKLLLEAGLAATHAQNAEVCFDLFRAAQVLKPTDVLPEICMGYVYFLQLELKKSCEIFEKVLKQEPQNEMARACLGLSTAFSKNGADKGEGLLEKALDTSTDEGVKKLAKLSIDFIDEYISKKPSPMDLHKEKKK